MLDVLRRNASSWIIKFILAFIALTFVWWGIGSFVGEDGTDVAAKVGETTITRNELDQAAAGLEKTYRDVYGAAFTPEMVKVADLRRQALDTLVQKTLLLEEARRLGFRASDAEVQRDIASNPVFLSGGVFNEGRYRDILASNRVSTTEFEEQKREELTLRKMDGLFAAAARTPETEARDRFELVSRKVRLVAAVADPAKMSVPPPSDADIAARYAETSATYRTPLRVKLVVARFDPAGFAPPASEISEKELRDAYERNTEKFQAEEERTVARIVLPYTAKTRESVRQKAEGYASEAKRGQAAFDNVARKSGGKSDVSAMRRKDAKPEVADAVFGAMLDSVAGPVDAGNSFQIFRINRIRHAETRPLAEVRGQVLEIARQEKGKDLVAVKAFEAQGKVSPSADLKTVAARYGVAATETEWIYDNTTGGLPPAVARGALRKAALADPAERRRTLDNVTVEPVGGSFYLYKVAAVEDPRTLSLNEVRDRVASAIVAQRRVNEAMRKAGVAAKAKSPQELEAIAKREGLPVTRTPFFAPLSSGALPEPLQGASPDVRKDVAALGPKNPVLPRPVAAGERRVVMAFDGEQAADPAEWTAGRDAFIRKLTEEKRGRLLSDFIAAKEKEAKVEISPAALK